MSRGLHFHVYSRWSRLLHRLNLHHTRTIGPLEPGGGYVTRCDWCGLSGRTSNSQRESQGRVVGG